MLLSMSSVHQPQHQQQQPHGVPPWRVHQMQMQVQEDYIEDMEEVDEVYEEEEYSYYTYKDQEQEQDQPMEDSDEDTEEASETDMGPHDEPLEIKEQMYQDKLSNLHKQLQQLREGLHPEYTRKLKKLEQQLTERQRLNLIQKEYLLECVEQDYILEKKAAAKEFEEKKVDLKENLLTDFEDKKKHIESERITMELNGDSLEVKPAMTRKLRRRPNEPAPVPDKRRKPPATTLTYLLDDKDIEADLRAIARGRPLSQHQQRSKVHHAPSHSPLPSSYSMSTPPEVRPPSPLSEARVEDGKLLYERRWYHRGQSVYVEGHECPRFPAHITAIGLDNISVKKATVEGNKFKVLLSDLVMGKVTIKRRAS